MKNYFVLLCAFFIYSQAFATDFRDLKLTEPTQSYLNAQWGPRDESNYEKIWKFPFRLLGRPLERLLDGKIGQGIWSTLTLPYDVVHANHSWGWSLYKSSIGTVLTPLSFISEAASDLASAGKSSVYANVRASSRIQVCAIKMPLLPFEHIFFVADRGEINNDQFYIYKSQGLIRESVRDFEASAYCFKVPLMKQESPSLAIERLNCMSAVNPVIDYRLLGYNCGGMTREMMHASGLGFPDVSNLGIGSNFADVPDVVKESFASRKVTCDTYIETIRKTIFDLEQGSAVDNERLQSILYSYPRKDVILQFIISAQRGGNSEAISSLHRKLTETYLNMELENYLSKDKSITGIFDSESLRVDPLYRKNLRKMFTGLSQSDLSAIEVNYPVLKKITDDLQSYYFGL